jgi:hypothetical protein
LLLSLCRRQIAPQFAHAGKKSSKRTFTVNFLMGEKDKKENILKAANLEHQMSRKL